MSRTTPITEWTNAANRAFKELAGLPKKQRKMALELICDSFDEIDEKEARETRERDSKQIPMFSEPVAAPVVNGSDANGSPVDGWS